MVENIGMMPLAADLSAVPVRASTTEAVMGDDCYFPGFYDKYDAAPVPFSRISPKHHRTFASTLPNDMVDEFGHLYTSYQIKGTFFPYNPQRHGPNDINEVFGLADDTDLVDGSLSKDLRAAGLPAEKVVCTGRLEEGIVRGERVPMPIFKSKLVEATRRLRSTADIDFETWVEQANFYGLGRWTETGPRLDDFGPNDAANHSFLAEMVAYQNRLATEYAEPVASINRPEDVERLVFQALPERVGQAVGLLGENGKVHNNLHTGNFLISGMFVDLDTVSDATPLGRDFEERGAVARVGRQLNRIGRILYKMGVVDKVPEASLIGSYIEEGLALTSEPLRPLL